MSNDRKQNPRGSYIEQDKRPSASKKTDEIFVHKLEPEGEENVTEIIEELRKVVDKIKHEKEATKRQAKALELLKQMMEFLIGAVKTITSVKE